MVEANFSSSRLFMTAVSISAVGFSYSWQSTGLQLLKCKQTFDAAGVQHRASIDVHQTW